MAPYEGPPACQRCGGALVSDFETCPCGGRSQYTARSVEQEPEPVPDWRDAHTFEERMAVLRRRYAPGT